MRPRNALLCMLAVGLAGCTDTIDSVTREYRNANNEAIDAMMMVTSEERAAEMTARVFKGMTDHYKAIDSRLDTVKRNTATQREFVVNVFQSDGVHMYLTELEVNAQRFSLEMVRMRHLLKQYQQNDEKCPALEKILAGDMLGPLRDQLANPKLATMIEAFPTAKNVNDYDKLFEAFENKRKNFQLKDSENKPRKIVLVN